MGDGSNLQNCKELVEELKLDNVIFHGRRPLEEMPDFYKMADAMLVTLSKNDIISKTLPGKVQSYMCASKPIIGCIDGEAQIIIDDAKCGMYCDSGDFKKLAEIQIKMASMDLSEFSKNSKLYYENNCGFSNTGRK